MNQQTIDMLTEMKMTAMAAEFANQIQDASFNSIGFEERLIRPLTSQESYDLLEIAESRSSRSTIFCTQYQPEGWYTRIDPDPESQSPISEAIMDRIIHNSYKIMVEGRVSMRERKGIRAASLKNDKTDA